MNRRAHPQNPEFPLEAGAALTGPGYRKTHEIDRGAVVIHTGAAGRSVCLKLDRIGYDFLHHYVIALDSTSREAMELVYVDPEEMLFDCFATLELELGAAQQGVPDVGHMFANAKGHFLKVKDSPKTQKMFGFIDLDSAMVRLRQERNLKSIHPEWRARARLGEEIVNLEDLLKRFAP